MSMIKSIGSLASKGLNSLNAKAYTGGKVFKNLLKFESDVFANSVKNIKKDAKFTDTLKDIFNACKTGAQKFFKKYSPKIVDKAKADYPKIDFGKKKIAAFIASAATAISCGIAALSDLFKGPNVNHSDKI